MLCCDNNEKKTSYMQNRELSWLKFNQRCMWQAKDSSNPLLERLRFLSIFTSNLDEFFMVRVGSLIDMLPLGSKYRDDKTGQTAQEQLNEIYNIVRMLYQERDGIYRDLENELRKNGVFRLQYDELTVSEQEYVENYFSNSILPMLSPMLVDAQHPFPHLRNKGIEICMRLHREGSDEDCFAMLPVPANLPAVVYLPGANVRYIGMEDLLLELVDVVFDTYRVVEKIQISVTRNADIHAEDEDCEKNEDFRKVMQKLFKDRRRLGPLSMEYAYELDKRMNQRQKDPDVVSIQITIYRLAGKSKLVKSLCQAAENGKKVTVLIELRARFDEQNNIDWSKEFEKSGCTIMYGMPNYKVHSKICLITRKEKGQLVRYTQVGTGNYNEKTSKLYTDLSLMTADSEIGTDAALFFRNMGIGKWKLHVPYWIRKFGREYTKSKICSGPMTLNPWYCNLPENK